MMWVKAVSVNLCLWILLPFVIGQTASAQSTGSVANPVIKQGASVGFAGAVAFDDGDESYAHRLDYRRSVGNSSRLSTIVFFNDRGGRYRYRRFAVDATHQFVSDRNGWNSAVQLRGTVSDGNDGASSLRVAWLNSWKPVMNGELRFIGLATREIGNDRRSGLALETRGEATWQTNFGIKFGAQMFNRYGRIGDFGSFNAQRHSAGGVIKGSLSEHLSYRINALTGISGAASDFELRIRLNLAL